jgi:hypothetical protein
MLDYILVFITTVVITGAIAFVWYHKRRQRIYRNLAQEREKIVEGHRTRIQTLLDPRSLHAEFERERIIRVENFLAPENLAELRIECAANRPHVERTHLPMHKKGGTLSYENIHRYAPACLGVYHSPEIHRWLAEVVGEQLLPTAEHDQSSCSLLYYNQSGDHINWHFDNFYKGRHFTILISVVNRSARGGISAGKLMQKKHGKVIELDMSENVLVIFEGTQVLHRASPVAERDERIMLSMTLCTDPRIGFAKELARRVKDTAYYGPRALVD